MFARIDQKTVSFTTRFNYTMTPTLSLQVYAEPFVSAGEYSNYKELVDGRAEKYEDRYTPYAYGGNADFNIRSFRTTNVLRWEYRPGSQLFLVWQQGKSDEQQYGDFQFGREGRGIPAVDQMVRESCVTVMPNELPAVRSKRQIACACAQLH